MGRVRSVLLIALSALVLVLLNLQEQEKKNKPSEWVPIPRVYQDPGPGEVAGALVTLGNVWVYAMVDNKMSHPVRMWLVCYSGWPDTDITKGFLGAQSVLVPAGQMQYIKVPQNPMVFRYLLAIPAVGYDPIDKRLPGAVTILDEAITREKP